MKAVCVQPSSLGLLSNLEERGSKARILMNIYRFYGTFLFFVKNHSSHLLRDLAEGMNDKDFSPQ